MIVIQKKNPASSLYKLCNLGNLFNFLNLPFPLYKIGVLTVTPLQGFSGDHMRKCT